MLPHCWRWVKGFWHPNFPCGFQSNCGNIKISKLTVEKVHVLPPKLPGFGDFPGWQPGEIPDFQSNCGKSSPFHFWNFQPKRGKFHLKCGKNTFPASQTRNVTGFSGILPKIRSSLVKFFLQLRWKSLSLGCYSWSIRSIGNFFYTCSGIGYFFHG